MSRSGTVSVESKNPNASGPTLACSICGSPEDGDTLREARWIHPEAVARLDGRNPGWRDIGACPACVQRALLETLLDRGHNAFHDGIQAVWPLDPEAAFGALPTPLRMHADPRFDGAGVTMAFVDAGFHPHLDLVQPVNRLRAWVDGGDERVLEIRYTSRDSPRWPGSHAADAGHWHGLMTSTSAAGNGWLSRGFYRGMASGAEVVLVQARDSRGRITSSSLARSLDWIRAHAAELGIRIVSLSVAGEAVRPGETDRVADAIGELSDQGILVVAAAGNDGRRSLLPPATAPEALTVGGLDDRNTIAHEAWVLWHASYGETANHAPKPEVVAPSLWVVAPVLPGSGVAVEGRRLFERRGAPTSAVGPDRVEAGVAARIAELKLVTPHYQHVEGTSFAAPIVASAAACMLQANPALGPRRLRELLIAAARPVPGAPPERQGAGAVDAGRAVALALADRHSRRADYARTPILDAEGATLYLHDHLVRAVSVLGSWNGWLRPGTIARQVEPGLWEARVGPLDPGTYAYKFLLDGDRWLTDPANPRRMDDGVGGWNSLLALRDAAATSRSA